MQKSSILKPISQGFPPVYIISFFLFIYPLILFPGALFYSPLVLTTGTLQEANEKYIFLPKLFLLLILGLLSLLEMPRHWLRHPFLYISLALIGLATISTLNSGDSTTFWLLGPKNRFDGILYQIGLLLSGVYILLVIRRQPHHWKLLITAITLGAIVQSIVVLIQRLGYDPIGPLIQWRTFSSPIGTIGHPGMVSGFLLPVLLVSIWMSLYSQQAKEQRLWLISTLILAIGLGVVQNRSALYALIVVLAWVCISQRSLKSLILSGLALVIVIGTPTAITSIPLLSAKKYQKSYLENTTLHTRLELWQMGLWSATQIRGEPVIGGGPDGFYLSLLRNPPLEQLIKFYRIEYSWPDNTQISKAEIVNDADTTVRGRWIRVHFARYGSKTNTFYDYPIPDKAHSYFIDRFLAYGGISLLLWIILYLYPIFQGVRSNRTIISGISWGLGALGIYYLTWFPVMQVEPIHLALVAIAWALLGFPDTSQTP